MRGNYALPDNHFRKDWQRFVRTWFDQPAKKTARRKARAAKAVKMHPRPVNDLRPVVRCQTVKYNRKIRAGRGFTLDELKAAGISRKFAPTVGICVDHRRKNRSEEAFRNNVARLKLYRSKLVIFPRNSSSKRVKKGDSTREECKAVSQVVAKQVLPISVPEKRIEARVITADERERRVVTLLHKKLVDSKLVGVRQKRVKARSERKAAGGGKDKKKGDAPADE